MTLCLQEAGAVGAQVVETLASQGFNPCHRWNAIVGTMDKACNNMLMQNLLMANSVISSPAEK